MPAETASTTELFEIIKTTRSMRRLKPDPVSNELIRKILEAGVCAPSGGNMQRWRFFVVKAECIAAGGHAGVPGLIEAFRQTGTAAVIDREIQLKRPSTAYKAGRILVNSRNERAKARAISKHMVLIRKRDTR